MPSYELALIIRKMSRPGTAAVLRRTAATMLEANGILYNIENLGFRTFPFRRSAHSHVHNEGHYFLMDFDVPAKSVPDLADEYRRDVDLVRFNFVKKEPRPSVECTLEEDMKPPPYRQDVQKMMAKGKERERIFKFNTGLSYDPFST